MKKNLFLLELNEINFYLVQKYIDSGEDLPGFSKILKGNFLTTSSEEKYEYLEPWIQWATVHTGKKYADHKIFRLGDIVCSSVDQIFEKVEKKGFKVGAISPMNAKNELKNPSYFIPDPWTNTKSDKSIISRSLSKAISQAVNDNSKSSLSFSSFLILTASLLFYISPKKLIYLFFYALSSIGKPWRKALFLDMLLYEIHKKKNKLKKPNFSTLFLNGGAHIQHHYFFNSKLDFFKNYSNPEWYVKKTIDPFAEMLKIYDSLISDILAEEKGEIIIATGLSQEPCKDVKFYYRLKDHDKFLQELNIDFHSISPRMSRDFLISFKDKFSCLSAEKKLKQIVDDKNIKLFAEIENRKKDLFVTLTYPYEINNETFFEFDEKKFFLKNYVSFVAIKNGDHNEKGYAYFSQGLSDIAPNENFHLSKIHNVVLDFFK